MGISPVDLALIALRQIFRHRRRYKNVVVGMALAISGLIMVMTIGDSVLKEVSDHLEFLGSATILKACWDDHRSFRPRTGQYSEKDIEELKKLSGARNICPIVTCWSRKVAYDRTQTNGRIIGAETNFLQTIHMSLSSGRMISDEDIASRKRVCVLGQTITRELFEDKRDALEKSVTVEGRPFQVIGVLGGVEEREFIEAIIIPISIARTEFKGLRKIRDLYVRAVNWREVAQLREQILSVLGENQPQYSDAIKVTYFPNRIEKIEGVISLIQLFLYAAISVALILGGIGIMNVMLAVVQERTTEIGLRKALGATEKALMYQFLVESVAISLSGAAIGVLLAQVALGIVRQAFGIRPENYVLVVTVLSSLVWGILVGLLSGLIPARNASRLDAAEAMRFE